MVAALVVKLVGQQDVFERGERGDELVALEDEAMVRPRSCASLSSARVADSNAVEADIAGGRVIETREQAEQSGFTRTGRAHDGNELALGDGEVDALEDVDGGRAGAQGFAERFDGDHGGLAWGESFGQWDLLNASDR